MLVWSRHDICNWYTPEIILSVFFLLFFSFLFFNFVVCKLCQKSFLLLSIFFLEFTLSKRIFQIPSKIFLATVRRKFTQEKSLSYEHNFFCFFTPDFLICYDPPCKFFLLPPGCSSHSHWPGRTSTYYTGTLTVLSKAS
jgi:hypothetical protein